MNGLQNTLFVGMGLAGVIAVGVLLSACGSKSNATTTQISENPNQAYSVKHGEQTLKKKYLLLDVRSAKEYQANGFKEAVAIPYSEIADKIEAVTLGDKNMAIKIYCRSGNRARVAIKTLQKMGYNNLENLRTVSKAGKYLQNNPIYPVQAS